MYKTSENSEKDPSQYPSAHADIIKCLVLSDQQVKNQKHSMYYHARPIKAANAQFQSLEPLNVFLKNDGCSQLMKQVSVGCVMV